VLDEPFVVPRVAAGVHHPGQSSFHDPAAGQHHDLRVEDWEQMIDVNIKGVLYGIAAAL
jgi:NAD(P)-dependent dehydrogenase (short-subunit alcohol dehydrogenase family)